MRNGAIKLKRQDAPLPTAWERVQLARHPQRPYTLDYLKLAFSDFLELHGDRLFGDDAAIVGGLATLGARTVMVIGHQKGRDTKENVLRRFGMARPEGYRKALRLMRHAEKFDIPVITLIDIPGADPSLVAEERGQAFAIAENLLAMIQLRVPVVSVIVGEGGSGGALALGLADRVLMLEHAIYSVISPEGAAAILYRDAGQAEAVSEVLKLTAQDLHSLGIIDSVVPEPEGGAHLDPAATAEALKSHVLAALRAFSDVPTSQLLDNRYKKYRHIGQGGKFWREKVRSGLSDVFGLLAYAVSRMEKSNRKKPQVLESAPRTRTEKSRSPATSVPRRAERD